MKIKNSAVWSIAILACALMVAGVLNGCARHTVPAVGAEKVLSNPDIKSHQKKLQIFPKKLRENYL